MRKKFSGSSREFFCDYESYFWDSRQNASFTILYPEGDGGASITERLQLFMRVMKQLRMRAWRSHNPGFS
jgi:hypothetical protein